jgi:hypothetical protein
MLLIYVIKILNLAYNQLTNNGADILKNSDWKSI